MAIVSNAHEFNVDDLFIDLGFLTDYPLYLKCEGFNFAGSIKLKAALAMVEAAEREGRLTEGSVLVESSSGNLGVALSVIAAARGYRFACVADSRSNDAALAQMRSLGAEVHLVTEPDGERGLVGARIRYVQDLCKRDNRYVWLNQYGNHANVAAHELTTAREIDEQFPELDVLFVGAGTTGTLMGCARYFKQNYPRTAIVAVDSVGSTLFGTPPGRRLIPGVGNGIRPEIFDPSVVDDVVMVTEPETVRTCHRMAGRGFLFGGSTGTVVSGAMSWLSQHAEPEQTAVAIAPDLGLPYLKTIYQPDWVYEAYGMKIGSGHA
ncbi:2,3-diaminopropionate biosynthesis protein SbnA [Streptomyces buecherae]|uniref:2,3-diaminopropionate biosynthesis protein SbnA n=1 Tax=Streptomyces buecherae TaxID=2763006 RepID=UPI0033C30BFD